MDSSSSIPRKKSCLIQNILISCLNFTLLILSLFSLIPVILIRNPPTSIGLAFLALSLVSLISSFAGTSSYQSRSCFITCVTLHVLSLTGQVMAVLMLFLKEKQSLTLLLSTRDPREAKALVRIECVIFVVMIPLQMIVLLLACVLNRCSVNREVEFSGEEGIGLDGKTMEGEELTKVKGKQVQWIKTDFEG